jgi:hypothetical protein
MHAKSNTGYPGLILIGQHNTNRIVSICVTLSKEANTSIGTIVTTGIFGTNVLPIKCYFKVVY